ncbi:MAG: hypothetical protein LBI69_00965 [Puniceicoccales bacterium]|jgi:hypothetical protein|nr:hypothetical protein [Puniceicoccales bacterium]
MLNVTSNWGNNSAANGSQMWNSFEQQQRISLEMRPFPMFADPPTTQYFNQSSDESVQNSSERYAAELKVLKQYLGFSVLSPQGMWDSEYGSYLEDSCEETEMENFPQPSASTTFSIDQLPIFQEKQPKEPECPSTTTLLPNPPESTDSTTRHLNQSSNESAQNSEFSPLSRQDALNANGQSNALRPPLLRQLLNSHRESSASNPPRAINRLFPSPEAQLRNLQANRQFPSHPLPLHPYRFNGKSMQNPPGQHLPLLAFPPIAANGWGMPYEYAIRPAFLIDQPPISLRKQREGAECPSSSHTPFRQPQIYANERKFNSLYAETLEKLNFQSANPIEIVNQLMRESKIGMQILAKVCIEKIPENAEQIPEAIVTWMLNALGNAEDVKICVLATNALIALPRTNLEFVREIFNHVKIDENLGKIVYLLERVSVDCDVKFLSFLTHADQAKILLKMQPPRVSGILCNLCGGKQMQFFGKNFQEIETENTIKILVEMDVHNAALMLTQMMPIWYGVTILEKMPLQFRINILYEVTPQAGNSLLSAMCTCGYKTSVVEIVKLIDVKKAALIFAEMALSPDANNVIAILKMLDSKAMVNSILQEILALNRHKVAMELFTRMNAKMMGNVLLALEEGEEMVKTLKFFNQFSQENAISVFNIMRKFEASGTQFVAKILATVIEQEMAMRILTALSVRFAVIIIKEMYANELCHPRMLVLLHFLAQRANKMEILHTFADAFKVNIILLMCKHSLYASAAWITLMDESILENKRLEEGDKAKIRTAMDEIKARDAML